MESAVSLHVVMAEISDALQMQDIGQLNINMQNCGRRHIQSSVQSVSAAAIPKPYKLHRVQFIR